MNKKERIHIFLKSNRFKLIEEKTSDFFGDYYCIFTNKNFQLRFKKSKSFETVDIRSNIPGENWYDLALVQYLLYNEKNLNKIITIEKHIVFLERKIENISVLFDVKNYLFTRKKLEELGNKRVQQMFPTMQK